MENFSSESSTSAINHHHQQHRPLTLKWRKVQTPSINRLMVCRRMVIVSFTILALILFLLLLTQSDPTTSILFPTLDFRDKWKPVNFLSLSSNDKNNDHENVNEDDSDDDDDKVKENNLKICSMPKDPGWTIPNFVWQMVKHRRLTYFLFGAYWDNRREDETAVRIVAMVSNGHIENTRLFCHLWYPTGTTNDDNEPLPVVMLAKLDIMWYNDDLTGPKFLPYLISCPVPKNFYPDSVPHAVSLAETYTLCSNVTNLLPIVYHPLPPGEVNKKNFAICHKALYYNHIDVSTLLIEWLEIHRILGVDKIVIYEYAGTSHPNISKILTHYAVHEQSFVEVKPYTLPGKNVLSPTDTMTFIEHNGFDKWLNELIPYHDCFFRHMHLYKYIVLVDVDEVILPVNGGPWSALLKNISLMATSEYPDKTISAFTFENNVFLDRIHGDQNDDGAVIKNFPQFPPYMHMMRNTLRVHQKGGGGRKGFFNTEAGLLLHNHDTIRCLQDTLDGGCLDYSVDDGVAQLNHYMWLGAKDQKTMKGWLDENETAVDDRTIWNYQNQLVPAVTKIYDQIFR